MTAPVKFIPREDFGLKLSGERAFRAGQLEGLADGLEKYGKLDSAPTVLREIAKWIEGLPL